MHILNTRRRLTQVDSCTESAEAACDILSQLVNCTIKTLGLISTARPSFMDVSQVRLLTALFVGCCLFLCVFVLIADVISVKVKQSKWFWSTEHPLPPNTAGPLCVGADSRVCQLQVPVLHQDWWYSSWRPVPEGPGCQQQRHPEAVEDEQLSSRLPSRSPRDFCYPAFICCCTEDQRLEERGWIIWNTADVRGPVSTRKLRAHNESWICQATRLGLEPWDLPVARARKKTTNKTQIRVSDCQYLHLWFILKVHLRVVFFFCLIFEY